MQDPLHLHGCRHDILGHYLKAIGLLRVLARCADPGEPLSGEPEKSAG